MSKFFRSPNSSGSDTDSDDGTEELSTRAAHLNVSDHSHSATSLESVVQDGHAPGLVNGGRDLLLHALLEERYINQVRSENGAGNRSGLSEDEIIREGRRRYQAVCARLAPLNLVSAGLDNDGHSAVRQTVRDRLDGVTCGANGGPGMRVVQAQMQGRGALPAPLRRLLTEGEAPSQLPLGGLNLPNHSHGHTHHSLSARRYYNDFEELGLLGKGGFGQVFKARHRLDQREYAIKKIPIHPAMVARIVAEGKQAMDEALAEIQTLSKLEHPNIVRYFSSWVEWSTIDAVSSDSSSILEGAGPDDADDFPMHFDALGVSLQRIRTESDTQASDIFESHSQKEVTRRSIEDLTDTGSSGQLVSMSAHSLILHMQMDVYPMTLADFIAPKAPHSTITPLAHCFHLETSIRILLAILEGVEYLHAKNIIHRDLKPANIFLRHEENPRATHHCVDLFLCSRCREEGQAQPIKINVRIGDFGLVTQLGSTSETTLPASTNVVGTELYRPRRTASNVDPMLDLHALGIIACELLCKFDTQMERRETLQGLKNGVFPKHFATCAGHHKPKLEECIESMLGNGKPSLEDIKASMLSFIETT